MPVSLLALLPTAALAAEPSAAAPPPAGSPAAEATPAEPGGRVERRRERLRQKREAQFRAADLDTSRSLTRAEIEAGDLPSALLRQFEHIDTDGDGALTPEELEAAQARRVEAAREARVQPQDG